MSQIYIGSPAYTSSITIPNDGDLASAASVNNPTKSEADMDYFLLQSMGLLTQGASVKLSSVDGATIVISALPLIVVNENGLYVTISTPSSITISRTSLEVGANFVPNTWYYIYAYSIASIANFQISLVPPDTNNLYKQGGDSYRYLGSIRTNGLSQILKVYSNRGKYIYLDTAYQLLNGSSTTELAIPLNTVVPPTTRLVDLHIVYGNNAGDSYFRLFTFPGGQFQQFSAFGSRSNDFSYTMYTNVDQTIRYLVEITNVRLSVSVSGYQE